MTKNAKIIIVLVVVLLIAGGVYFGNKSKEAGAPQGQVQSVADPTLNPVGGQTVGEKIPETNPFKTQVNPYDSYKNPFN